MSTWRTSLATLALACGPAPEGDGGPPTDSTGSLCPGEGGEPTKWVQADAPVGGDGSAAAPFVTLQEAVDAAGIRTRIVLVGDQHVGGAIIDEPARHQGLAIAGCGPVRVVGGISLRGTPGAALLDVSLKNLFLSGPLDIAYAHGVDLTDVGTAGVPGLRGLHSTVTLRGTIDVVGIEERGALDFVGGTMILDGTLAVTGGTGARFMDGAALQSAADGHFLLSECVSCLTFLDATAKLGSVTVTGAESLGIGLLDSVVTAAGPITILGSGGMGVGVYGDGSTLAVSGGLTVTNVAGSGVYVADGGSLTLDAPVTLTDVGVGLEIAEGTVTGDGGLVIDGTYDAIRATAGASVTLSDGTLTGVERIGVGTWGGDVELDGTWTVEAGEVGVYVDGPEGFTGEGHTHIPGQVFVTGGLEGVLIDRGGRLDVAGSLRTTDASPFGVALTDDAELTASGDIEIADALVGLYLNGSPTFTLSGTAILSDSINNAVEAIGGTIEVTPTGSLLLDGAGSVGLHVDGGTAYLEGTLDVRDVAATCVYATDSEFEIASATLTGCERYGIVVVGGTALLSDIAIGPVGIDGILLSDLATPPTLSSVSVTGAGRAAALLVGPGGSWEQGSLETSTYAIVQQGCTESEAITLRDVTLADNVDNAAHLCDGTTLSLPE